MVIVLERMELVFWSRGVSPRGAGSGFVFGGLEWSKHNSEIQITSGKGLVLRFVFLDCCLFISAMISSTGRSAGQEGGLDCANIPALTTTIAKTYRMWTTPLYSQYDSM